MSNEKFDIPINTRLHKFARKFMLEKDYDHLEIIDLAREWKLFELIPLGSFMSQMESYIVYYDIRNSSKNIGKRTGKGKKGNKRGRRSNADRFEIRCKELKSRHWRLEKEYFVTPDGHKISINFLFKCKNEEFDKLVLRHLSKPHTKAPPVLKTKEPEGVSPYKMYIISDEELEEARKRHEDSAKLYYSLRMLYNYQNNVNLTV